MTFFEYAGRFSLLKPGCPTAWKDLPELLELSLLDEEDFRLLTMLESFHSLPNASFVMIMNDFSGANQMSMSRNTLAERWAAKTNPR